MDTHFRISETRPISHLFAQIQEEDPSILETSVFETGNTRIAKSTLGRDVLQMGYSHPLTLKLNDTTLQLKLPTFEERTRDLTERIEQLNLEIEPMQVRMRELDSRADRAAVRLTWTGLAALCAQWGIMARLTWWEYSWDVMEPISYFLTAGTGILAYMFYLVTSKEYTYESLHGVTFSSKRLKLYSKNQFDINRLVQLRESRQQLLDQLNEIKRQYS